MTKTELIDKIASGAGLSKADASRALDATLDAVKASLKKGQKVTLVGFGTFAVTKRKARKGRNPRTISTNISSIIKPDRLSTSRPPRRRSLRRARR